MQAIGEVAAGFMKTIGSADHIPANPGDFIGEDGLLHCGICSVAKEMLFPFSGKYVPCICKCQKDALEREKAERQLREEIEYVKELASWSLVDEKFHEAKFENYIASTPEEERILRICRNYADHFDEMYAQSAGLLFYGSPGTGKTFAASCIANALMEKRVPVLVTSIIRITADMFGDDLNELLYRMNKARLLVLDDFGAERDTEFKAEQIFAVIDARYAAKKPMIITTNLTDFKSETNVRRRRIYDRIFEVCMPIRLDGESKRRIAGNEKRDAIRAILEGQG